jgi:predicted short-subunit dehydrogenase-like oxidoreductase (DUF2520 family)
VSASHPTLAIIGAGRVGRALGRALRQRGWQIEAVVTRSPKTARAAVRAIGAGRAQSRIDASSLTADVIFITTPDRAIAAAARELARLPKQGGFVGRGFNRYKKGTRAGRLQPLAGITILHTNGTLDRSVLAPLEKLGAATGSLHPLQTFGLGTAPKLDGCICAIEGTARALRMARRIADELGCIPVAISPQAKPAYHAAGALAAGHVLAIIEAATRILLAIGFTRKQAVRALLPLTRQTLENFQRLGANAAWTGPLARGDFATVKKHEAALRKFPREYVQAYQALSKLALQVLAGENRE